MTYPGIGTIDQVNFRHAVSAVPQIGVLLTRHTDATPYAAGDAVNNSPTAPAILQFPGASRLAGGSLYITGARIVTDLTSCVAQLRLWLYSAAAVDLENDNAPFLIKWTDRAARLGFIDLPALSLVAGSDCAEAIVTGLNIPAFTDGAAVLYGQLQTNTAFTPASAQNIYLQLATDQS